MKKAGRAAKQFWRRAIEDGAQHEGDLKRAVAYVDETGAIEETQKMAGRYADQAARALAAVPPLEIRDALAAVAEFCVARAY